MKIATVLFTYNRSHHANQVIEALKCNTVLPQKLFIFQDGCREGEDDTEWKKVNHLIYDIDWCDKEIIVSEYNKGLADSIVSGLNYVFREYEAAIVLEDDCVPASDFLNFMYQCLEKYLSVPRVYSVSGYAWPIELPEGDEDIYFCGRISSWGWGTWKNRWEMYQKDYTLLKQINHVPDLSDELAIWGADLREILTGNVNGENNSWAIFWALLVIRNRGVCINPYLSLIRNIGHDGSGVNCGTTDKFKVPIDEGKNTVYKLPDKIQIFDTTKREFRVFSEHLNGTPLAVRQTYYRNCLEKWLECKQQGKNIAAVLLDKNIKRIAIYGMGTIGELLIGELSDIIEVTYIVVSNKYADEFMGYPVYGCEETLPEISDQLTLIIIPGYDMEIIERTVGKKFSNMYSLDALFSD